MYRALATLMERVGILQRWMLGHSEVACTRENGMLASSERIASSMAERLAAFEDEVAKLWTTLAGMQEAMEVEFAATDCEGVL